MHKSFGYAFQGIKYAFRSELNLKVHFLIAVIIFALAFLFKFNYLEFAILSIVICLVITLEILNTIVEKFADAVHPEISDKIKVIKDMSAGVVLIAAFFSIIVGLLLFAPKFF